MNMGRIILISKDELTKISLRDSRPGSHFMLFFCSCVWPVQLSEQTTVSFLQVRIRQFQFQPRYNGLYSKKKRLLPK